MKYNMTSHEAIVCMKEFTAVHASFPDNIYLREANCLEKQLQYSMLPPKDDDLLVGRRIELPICFTPQSSCASVGYCCNEKALLEMLVQQDLTDEDRQDIQKLLAYWKGKTTTGKIKSHYSEEMLTYLTQGDYAVDKGTAFPLYRLSGAQMSPQKLLSKGLDALIKESADLSHKNPDFYQAVCFALKSFQALCLRYSNLAMQRSKQASLEQDQKKWQFIADNLLSIAHQRPVSFWQAAQLSYLYYLVSGAYNYGRMDEYLGDFYVNDLKNGILTEEEALAILKGLWRLIIDRQDTVFDGRVILGGKGRRNTENADRFSLAAMEASRQMKDILPQLTLRCYKGMNQDVYETALHVIGEGTTFPMLYNDDVNISCVEEAFGVSEKEAENYVPFGCGEYVLYNRSFGTPSGIINYLTELNAMIYEGEENLLKKYDTFSAFYDAFLKRLKTYIVLLSKQEKLEYDVCAEEAPFLYYSLLFDDCMSVGKPIFNGGIHYLGGTLEGYGNTNTCDSLTAIKKLVYDEKKISPEALANALQHNFEGFEKIHQMLLNAPKYGNDDSYADSIAVQFHNDICDMIRDCKDLSGLDSYLQVIINNQTNTTFGLLTGASADGRSANTFFANGNNPTGGMDKNGVTAMLNSLVKLSPRHHAGSVQNMRFSHEMFGPLLPKTKGLLAAYFQNGGTQAMITVLNRNDLKQALLYPEKYQNLIVRVGGFSARFVELSRPVQEELISRTLY